MSGSELVHRTAEASDSARSAQDLGLDIAIVQRAQAIAASDHAALVQAQCELAEARAELMRLRWRARRTPTISGRRGLGRQLGTR